MKFLKVTVITIVALLLVLFISGQIYYASQKAVIKSPRLADSLRIKNDVFYLANECRYRNYRNLPVLNKTADYIKANFLAISPRVTEQAYDVKGTEFKNIICSLGPENGERIIIGAHYDVCGDQDGADDNASGIAGLLELARLLTNQPLQYRVDLVAYTLEEPPFFKTENMGSYFHAKFLHDQNIPVKVMICLETIGYYSDVKGSQTYPAFFLKWFYGNKGNFITVVQKFSNGRFGRSISNSMKEKQVIPTRSFRGPAWIPGVDFSDHLNYWKFGYSAVLITNTAFYRNFSYHTANDKAANLNCGNIGLVVDEVYSAIQKVK